MTKNSKKGKRVKDFNFVPIGGTYTITIHGDADFLQKLFPRIIKTGERHKLRFAMKPKSTTLGVGYLSHSAIGAYVCLKDGGKDVELRPGIAEGRRVRLYAEILE